MEVTEARLDAWIDADVAVLDAKAEVAAENLKRGLLRARLARERWRLIWFLAGLVALWIGARLELVRQLYLKEAEWWSVSGEEFGYEHGRPPSATPERVTVDTAIVALEYPPIRWAQVLFEGNHIPRAGAEFLLGALREHGRGLSYVNWRGGSAKAADFLRVPVDAALDCAEGRVGGAVDWHAGMDAWAAKRHKRSQQPIERAYRTTGGVVDYSPRPDEEYVNPWAGAYGFRTTGDMANSRAVHAYLCAPSKHATVLHVLFERGLVGVAVEFGARMDATGAALLADVFGRLRAPLLEEAPCETAKMKAGLDIFTMATGFTGLATGLLPRFAPPVLAVGVLGSAGLAYSSYRSTECGVRSKRP